MISRISVAPDGTEGNSGSATPSLSANGRYIAFHSASTNLIPVDTNGQVDVFVYDQQTKEMSRVSVSSTGIEGNRGSHAPVISTDGRYVVFSSDATNLVDNDTNGMADVFVHDRQTGQTKRVSVASDGSEGDDFSGWYSVSGNGHYIAFASWSTNLVSNDTNDEIDVFVYDQQSEQTIRVSVNSSGVGGNRGSFYSSISGDGRYVVFHSSSTNLIADDTNGVWDVFIHDLQTHQTSRVSVASDGTEANDHSVSPTISADGHYVFFESLATNLVAGYSSTRTNIFVRDLLSAETGLVSVSSDGTEGNWDSYRPVASFDGRYIAFYSSSTNLASSDGICG